MATGEPIRIIGNESNTVHEIEPGSDAATAEPKTAGEKEAAAPQSLEAGQGIAAQRSNEEVATNDGAVVETLDTAFHNKPGVAEGENLSGSSRADYYESKSYGKTDAEEELDALNNEPS